MTCKIAQNRQFFEAIGPETTISQNNISPKRQFAKTTIDKSSKGAVHQNDHFHQISKKNTMKYFLKPLSYITFSFTFKVFSLN